MTLVSWSFEIQNSRKADIHMQSLHDQLSKSDLKSKLSIFTFWTRSLCCTLCIMERILFWNICWPFYLPQTNSVHGDGVCIQGDWAAPPPSDTMRYGQRAGCIRILKECILVLKIILIIKKFSNVCYQTSLVGSY